MAAEDEGLPEDNEGGDLLGPASDDDLEAQMAAAMAVESMTGTGEDDDLEAQMAAAMATESGASAAVSDSPMRNGGNGMGGRNGFMDALSDDGRESAPPVQPVRFQQLRPSDEKSPKDDIDRLLDISLNVAVELGRKQMQIKEILELGPGKIIELEKLAGEPVDLMVNGKLLARGEVVVVDENFGVRITELVDPKDRIKML